MKRLGITLETGETVPLIHHVKEDPDLTTLKTKLNKLFNESYTGNGLEEKIQPKGDAKLIQQKGRHIPIHLQSLEKEIEELTKQDHLEKPTTSTKVAS